MALISFIIVFSPQFIFNYLQLGSPLTFPYVLHHNNAAKGFMISSLDKGIPFLIGCNYLYMAMAVTGLCFTAGFRNRIIWTLWIVPLVLFFCGYPVAGASPIRFILPCYIAMIAVLICSNVWKSVTNHQKWLILPVIALNVIFISPCCRLFPHHPFYLELYPWGNKFIFVLNIILPVISALTALGVFYRQPKVLFFFMLFIVLFNAGSPLLIFTAFCIILLYVFYDWGKRSLSFIQTWKNYWALKKKLSFQLFNNAHLRLQHRYLKNN